ncbi:hypothetical protein SALBM311S_12586 [Streptomyces alboniger]
MSTEPVAVVGIGRTKPVAARRARPSALVRGGRPAYPRRRRADAAGRQRRRHLAKAPDLRGRHAARTRPPPHASGAVGSPRLAASPLRSSNGVATALVAARVPRRGPRPRHRAPHAFETPPARSAGWSSACRSPVQRAPARSPPGAGGFVGAASRAPPTCRRSWAHRRRSFPRRRPGRRKRETRTLHEHYLAPETGPAPPTCGPSRYPGDRPHLRRRLEDHRPGRRRRPAAPPAPARMPAGDAHRPPQSAASGERGRRLPPAPPGSSTRAWTPHRRPTMYVPVRTSPCGWT